MRYRLWFLPWDYGLLTPATCNYRPGTTNRFVILANYRTPPIHHSSKAAISIRYYHIRNFRKKVRDCAGNIGVDVAKDVHEYLRLWAALSSHFVVYVLSGQVSWIAWAEDTSRQYSLGCRYMRSKSSLWDLVDWSPFLRLRRCILPVVVPVVAVAVPYLADSYHPCRNFSSPKRNFSHEGL